MPTNRETYFSLLKENNKYLNRNVVNTLLCFTNGFDCNLTLYKNFDNEVKSYENFLKLVDRVRNGEPYQYVIGKANFIDLTFNIEPGVLIPRQETEELVIGTKVMIDKIFEPFSKINIADVCTGSGVIGIYLKKFFRLSTVYVTDIDKHCLEIAKSNSQLHNLPVIPLQGDLLEPLIEKGIKLDVLVCNPPYIGDESTIDPQVWKYEPHSALLAKPKTSFYERIFQDADRIMNKNALLAFEIGEDMENELCDLVEKYFPNSAYKLSKDMYGKMRFLYIMIKEDGNYA